MPSDPREHWTQELKTGVLEISELEILGALSSETLLGQFRPIFPIPFLEGHSRNKLEIGLAQKRRRHRYQRCLILTFESERLTSLASLTFLRIRPSRIARQTRELTSGAGFNVYRDVDGWKIKLLEERTVALRDEALRKRGWSVAGP